MKIANQLLNVALALSLALVLYFKGPSVYNNFKLQNTQIENFEIPLLDAEIVQSTLDGEKVRRTINSEYSQFEPHTGPIFSLVGHKRKLVVVFWATWCGYCRTELQKLNELVVNGEVAADSILAVSIGETKDVVQAAVRDRGYRFKIAIDADRSLAQKFNVVGTPTIVFIDENRKIEWMTSGLSAALETRVTSFLD